MPNSSEDIIHDLALLARSASRQAAWKFQNFLKQNRQNTTLYALPYVAYIFYLCHTNQNIINLSLETNPNLIYDSLQAIDRANGNSNDETAKRNRQAQDFFNALFTNMNYFETLKIIKEKEINFESVSYWQREHEQYRVILTQNSADYVSISKRIKDDAQTALTSHQAIKTDLALLARFAKRTFPPANGKSSFSVLLGKIKENDSTATNIAAYMIHLMQQLSHSNQSLQKDELIATWKDVYYRNPVPSDVPYDFTSDINEDIVFFTDFSNTQNQEKIVSAIGIDHVGNTLALVKLTNPLKEYNEKNPENKLLTVEFTPQYLESVKTTIIEAKTDVETKAIKQAKAAAIKLLEGKHSRLSSIRTNNKGNKQLKQDTLTKLASAATLNQVNEVLDNLKNDWKPRYHAVFFKRAKDHTETDTFKKVEEIQNEYSDLLDRNPSSGSGKFS